MFYLAIVDEISLSTSSHCPECHLICRERHTEKQTETERGREERFSRVDTGWRLLSRIGLLRIENKTLLIENSNRSGSHNPPSLPLSLRAVD
jgi:hypothetical protein